MPQHACRVRCSIACTDPAGNNKASAKRALGWPMQCVAVSIVVWHTMQCKAVRRGTCRSLKAKACSVASLAPRAHSIIQCCGPSIAANSPIPHAYVATLDRGRGRAPADPVRPRGTVSICMHACCMLLYIWRRDRHELRTC